MWVHQDQVPPPRWAPVATAGCRVFTSDLRNVVWPSKFKPDLPPRYNGTTDPTEFLQLYELSIEAANDYEKIMAKWFSMALVGVLGTGVPRIACLRPAAWLEEWPSTAHLHQHMLKTLARG